MSRTADLAAIIDRQDGSDVARARTRVLMRMASGALTLDAAADELGISPQRLHALRERMLAGTVAAAEPLPPGRPRVAAEVDPSAARIAELEAENARLRIDLECAFLRTELELTFGDRLPSLKNERRRPAAAGSGSSSGNSSGNSSTGPRLPRRERRERERAAARQRRRDGDRDAGGLRPDRSHGDRDTDAADAQ